MPRTNFVWGFFRGVILISEQDYMNLAFEMAEKGKYQTWTNPLVGAVIVKNNVVLAKGYHHQFGAAHAEIDALQHLDDLKQARGATMYVSLEPCSHFGKTPPCAKKLAEVGIKAVVVGQKDPNPLVAGRGLQILRDAGIEIKVLNQTGGLNVKYNFFYQHQRPYVNVKYAMTLDGKINQQANQRSIITGKEAYQDSQQLRAEYQAILVGENTLKVDHPQLTVRQIAVYQQPWRMVLIRDVDQLKVEDYAFFKTADPILLLTLSITRRQWPSNVEVISDRWTPNKILTLLAKRGIQSVLVEGGSQIHAEFLASGLVDEINVYLAPRIYGATGLPAIFNPTQLPYQSNAYQLVEKMELGPDMKFRLRRV